MNQRVGIAMAMLMNPALVLADEATSALDVTVQAQIIALLQALQKKHTLAYLFICHNLALVQFFCHRVLVMAGGCLVEEGPPDRVINQPQCDHTKRLIEACSFQ